MNVNIFVLLTLIILTLDWSVQHASSDVEKMVLGNKCDMEDRRLVSKERGTQVDLHVAYTEIIILDAFLALSYPREEVN